VKKKLQIVLKRSELGRKIVEDSRFRAFLIACITFCVNVGYAALNFFLAITHRSFSYLTLFADFLALSLMRFYTVTYEFRGSTRRTKASVMRFSGIWLCFLSIVVSGLVVMTIMEEQSTARPIVLMIAIATYTFWKAVMAVINTIKAHSSQEPLLITLRNISCADAAISVLTLEHAMICTFSDEPGSFSLWMDAGTGMGVFLMVLGLGIGLLIQSKIQQKSNE